MDVNDFVCRVCDSPPQSLRKSVDQLRQAVVFDITCHGLCCKVWVRYEEALSVVGIIKLVQLRYDDALKVYIPNVAPKAQVSEAPLVLIRPQRKIDLE